VTTETKQEKDVCGRGEEGRERGGGRGTEGGRAWGTGCFLANTAVDEALCIVRLISLAASYRNISEVAPPYVLFQICRREKRGFVGKGERGEKGEAREGGGSARAQTCRKKKKETDV